MAARRRGASPRAQATGQNHRFSSHGCVTPGQPRNTTGISQRRSDLLTVQTWKAAVLTLRAYRAAFQATQEVAPDGAPAEDGSVQDGADANWRAIDTIKHRIGEDSGVFEREARMRALEELKRGTTMASWSGRGCLCRIIQALLRYLNLFALLLSRLFFFEFPNNLRHLCTTMPWSIWPALAVLWGVCWMFYERADGRTASHGRFVFVSVPSKNLTMRRARDAEAGVPVPS